MAWRNSLWYVSRPFSKEDKEGAVNEVLEKTLPDRDFYLLVFGAVLFAVCGIFLDSVAVLIASMIIAPLAYPILGLGLGIVVRNRRLVARTAGMLVIAIAAAILGAAAITLFFGYLRVDPAFISFESNLYLATVVAIIAGFIAAYGLVRSKVGSAMTGIGIAVSLMPPLVATGIGLVDAASFPLGRTLLVFFLNVVGILAGSIVVFSAMGFASLHRRMDQTRI
ncbi:MAG: DUF389 domain-containing protein [Patescibacteria group bacterium]|nr:DUF389 domain-containing protein [Patescibacteria group bacterium]